MIAIGVADVDWWSLIGWLPCIIIFIFVPVIFLLWSGISWAREVVRRCGDWWYDFRWGGSESGVRSGRCPACGGDLNEVQQRSWTYTRRHTLKHDGLPPHTGRGLGDTQGFGWYEHVRMTERYTVKSLRCGACQQRWKLRDRVVERLE
jgi:hypothetical protein